MDPAETQLQIERELRQEKAAALSRIARRLEDLLEQADRRRRAAEAAGPRERCEAVEAYNRVAEEASLQRWYLEVQRESLGLRRHEDVHAAYPLPPRLR